MPEVVLKTNKPEKVSEILKEALEKEKLRIKYSLDLAVNRLKKFEQKYKIPTETFINQWSAEDLEGGDMEYVRKKKGTGRKFILESKTLNVG